MEGIKILYEIAELPKRNGGPVPMSLAGIYKACAEGKIPTVKVGRRVFVPSWWLERLLEDPEGKGGLRSATN